MTIRELRVENWLPAAVMNPIQGRGGLISVKILNRRCCERLAEDCHPVFPRFIANDGQPLDVGEMFQIKLATSTYLWLRHNNL